MITLDTPLKSLEIVLGGNVTANQLPVVVAYFKHDQARKYSGGNDTQTNNTTAVTILAAPDDGSILDVQSIFIHNADTVNATVTVRLNNNGTYRTIVKSTLTTLTHLYYEAGYGWRVL